MAQVQKPRSASLQRVLPLLASRKERAGHSVFFLRLPSLAVDGVAFVRIRLFFFT